MAGFTSFRDRRVMTRRSQQTPRQRGTRTVQHLFGRLMSAESTVQAHFAIPLLPGETLRRLDMTMWVCTDDNDLQPDSAIPYMTGCVMAPASWTTSLNPFNNTSDIEQTLEDWVSSATTSAPFESDPNPTGNAVIDTESVTGYEGLWADWRLLHSPFANPSYFEVAEVLATADARAMDKVYKRFERNMYTDQGALIVGGIYTPVVSAQTDFGVADFDSGVPSTLLQVVNASPTDLADLSSTQLKMYELLYGGDTYIEADTLKSMSSNPVRFQGLVQALIGTPWPQGQATL